MGYRIEMVQMTEIRILANKSRLLSENRAFVCSAKNGEYSTCELSINKGIYNETL